MDFLGTADELTQHTSSLSACEWAVDGGVVYLELAHAAADAVSNILYAYNCVDDGPVATGSIPRHGSGEPPVQGSQGFSNCKLIRPTA